VAVAVAALLVAGVILLSVWPLLQPLPVRAAADAASRRADLVAERDRVLAALKDVDLDLQMGKVGEQDHALMKAGLERQAFTVLSRIETERHRGTGSERRPGAAAPPRDPA
jgi:hypothetical protein